MSQPTIAEVLAKFSPEDVAAFVAKFEAENKSTAEANVRLSGGTLDGKKYEGKMRPEDERPEPFRSVDAVRETLFTFAATLSEVIKMTAGDPDGGNRNTKSDRWQIEIPTPTGRLAVNLYKD
jgi:hypothetical protein